MGHARKLSTLDRLLRDVGACPDGIKLARGKTYREAWAAAQRHDRAQVSRVGYYDCGISWSFCRWLCVVCRTADFHTPQADLVRPPWALVLKAARTARRYAAHA